MYTNECSRLMLISKYPQVKTNDSLWMMIFVKMISICLEQKKRAFVTKMIHCTRGGEAKALFHTSMVYPWFSTYFDFMINVFIVVVWIHRVQKSRAISDGFICCLRGETQSKNSECRQKNPVCSFNQLENCKSFQWKHVEWAECIQREE